MEQQTYRVTIEGLTPYSQSRHYDTPKKEKETSADYEARTWRERLHVDSNGIVFIPPMSFKVALAEAAKFLSMQVPGKGKATYTKHFEAGILIMDMVSLGIHKDQVPGETLFVPADGVRGSGKRVSKTFGRIDKWGGTFDVFVMDPAITRDVLLRHLQEAGRLIGIGRFRPRNNGFYGRFNIVSMVEVGS